MDNFDEEKAIADAERLRNFGSERAKKVIASREQLGAPETNPHEAIQAKEGEADQDDDHLNKLFEQLEENRRQRYRSQGSFFRPRKF